MLALRGGGELVALWAQLASVIEIVAGVAGAGVGTGITVLVAQALRPVEQRELLGRALMLALVVSLPVALAIVALGLWHGDVLGAAGLDRPLVVVGALAGWIAVVPVLLGGYWLGQQRRGAILALTAVSAVISLAAALVAPVGQVLALLAAAQALPALAVLPILAARREAASPEERHRGLRALRGFVLPGLAIGILSPASTLVARAAVSEAMSWHEAGLLQALWRLADWVCAPAAGILSLVYLPRFALAVAGRSSALPSPGESGAGPALGAEARGALRAVAGSAALVLVVLGVFQAPLLALLYDESFRIPTTTVALFFVGSLVRIVSWVPLFGLYALRATRAIALGELLSLPLFALLLVAAGDRLTLEWAGAAWLVAYLAYAAFNLGAVRWHLRRSKAG